MSSLIMRLFMNKVMSFCTTAESSTITPEFDLDLEEVSQGLQEDDKEQEEDKVQDLLDLDDYFDDNQVHGEQEEEEIVIIEAPSGSKSTPKITLVPKIRQNRGNNKVGIMDLLVLFFIDH